MFSCPMAAKNLQSNIPIPGHSYGLNPVIKQMKYQTELNNTLPIKMLKTYYRDQFVTQ